MALRCLRALLLALLVLSLVEALLSVQMPPRDRTPLPWRGRQLFPWGAEIGNGVHRTRLGQLVQQRRPPGRLRVAVFGSSAVEGIGATLYHAFPWRLQRRLERRGLDVEVLNLGLAGRDSGHHRGAVLRALQELDPSVVLVYAGNNELLRLRAYKHLNPGWTARSEGMRVQLERLALYRWLAGWFQTAVSAGDSPRVDDLPGDVTAEDRELATFFHRRNLEGIVAACAQAGVPLVLCTVATSDESLPDYGRPGASEAHARHARGMAALERGDFRAAREDFDEARELDPAPRRILPSWNRTIRELGSQGGVVLCDVEERLRAGTPHGLLGRDLLWDHCHLNLEGHERAAAALEEGLEEAGLLPEAASPGRPADPEGLESLAMDDVPEDYLSFVHLLQGVTDEEGPALATLDAAARRQPDRAALWRDLARASVLGRRFPEARDAYARFLRAGGWDPAAGRDLELLELSGAAR